MNAVNIVKLSKVLPCWRLLQSVDLSFMFPVHSASLLSSGCPNVRSAVLKSPGTYAAPFTALASN